MGSPPSGPGSALPSTILYVHPWDLSDDGLARFIDHSQEIGVDGVQLALSYHIGTYLLPRNPRRVAYYGNHGSLYFEPLKTGSRPGGVKPAVADASARPSDLAGDIRRLAEAGIGTIAWLVYCYNHAVAREQPHLAVENAFADVNQAQLCPSHPEVRRFALELTDEVLDRFELAGIVAESLSFLPFDYGFLNPKAAVRPDEMTRKLLGLCFCPHCRRLASERGVEVPRLRAEVQEAIRRGLAGADEIELERAVASELAAYHATRKATATELQRDVLGLARQKGRHAGSTSVEGSGSPEVSGVDAGGLSDLVTDARVFVGPGDDPDTLARGLERLRLRAPVAATPHALLQPGEFEDQAAFRKAVEMSLAAGLSSFRFYTYGILSDRHLAWLKSSRDAWSRSR